MNNHEWLAERFQENRGHLRAVAYRMLGSLSEADDAVQESWLKLSRSDTSGVENLGGWLTTVVARVCLDMLRSRKSRREEPLGPYVPEPIVSRDDRINPEHEVLLADSVALALLVVLETLAPDERLAFVLHDMFGVPFDQIASTVGRSEAAARQLASRARRKVQGAAPVPDADLSRQREVVKRLPRCRARRQLRRASRGARSSRRATGRRRCRGSKCLAGGPRCAGSGRTGPHLFANCRVCAIGAREWSPGSCFVASGWTSVVGDGLHGQKRKDCRNRHTRRPGASPPDGPGNVQRLAIVRVLGRFRCGCALFRKGTAFRHELSATP